MTIYEITTERIVPFDETSFEAAGLRERDDLQRLLHRSGWFSSAWAKGVQ